MELRLTRTARNARCTIGKLYVNNAFICDTLEDCDRGLDSTMPLSDIKKRKEYGVTAIPVGMYEISMNIRSPKYSGKPSYGFTGGYMPRLLRVPGFEGILIHGGNTAADTFGCILVGENTAAERLTNSLNTFKRLYVMLKDAAARRESIYISIK